MTSLQKPTPLLGSQRALFDLPEEVAWLNCAQHSPALKAVSAAGAEGCCASAAMSAAAMKKRRGAKRSESPKKAEAKLPATKPACTALV